MKLLMAADGGSIHTERWCRYFGEQQYEVALFTLEPCTIDFTGKLYQGKRISGVGMVDYSLAVNNFKKTVSDFTPDLISAHFVVSYGWLAVTAANCPTILTAWGSDLLVLPGRSPIHRKRIKTALEKAVGCIVDGKNLADAAAEFTSREKIMQIAMGVDRDVFVALGKREFRRTGPIRILAPRGLAAVYDPETILKAVSLVKNKIDFGLDMIANGNLTKACQQRIDEMKLTDTVRLVPAMKHRPFLESLHQYDIYLAASLSDSTSVALLEGMAAGLYPVVSDIAGNREWIVPEDNGLLFRPGDASALADCLEKAVETCEKFGDIAQKNREIIRARGIWQDNMERVDALFKKTVASA